MSTTKKLADRHEADVAEWFHGHRSKSSGNQWNDRADGRQNHYDDEFAFAWDCKCAMPGTKSIGITREMLDKINDQSSRERPMIPLRFYASERGAVEHDWVAIRSDDLREILDALAVLRGR